MKVLPILRILLPVLWRYLRPLLEDWVREKRALKRIYSWVLEAESHPEWSSKQKRDWVVSQAVMGLGKIAEGRIRTWVQLAWERMERRLRKHARAT
jgi:hypothetical protein